MVSFSRLEKNSNKNTENTSVPEFPAAVRPGRKKEENK